MNWQDLIFAIGSISFSIALIPAVRAFEKPPVKTSAVTGFWLTVFGITYIAMAFYFAAVTTLISAGLWWTLAIQKYKAETNNVSYR